MPTSPLLTSPTIAGTASPKLENAPLRSMATARGIDIGAAVAIPALRNESIYQDTLARTFSLVTAENVMKFAAVEPARGQFNFSDADFLVDFALNHDMKVRGHTLVWHQAVPAWVQNATWTKDELKEVLRNHILTTVRHFRGKVFAWDVVNEAFEEDGSWRKTIWYSVIGPEYLELAFLWAREADPDALLFYNDYNIETSGRKSDAVYTTLKNLRNRGIPVDGVGLQMHITLAMQSSLSSFKSNLNRLAGLGLVVHITEMDVRLQTPVRPADLEKQAELYGTVLSICLNEPACKALVTWGLTDRHSWIPQFFPGYGNALLFDENYLPKPAYNALVAALR